ncbi:DNA primase small subunit-like isoform X2 [Prorops nasuta]|uniref:DNA primase small subunit-like isoform X2 n=1 Tax=Prorops nasuta TaxID=863751 RepID=UPI0034CFC742
MEGNLNEYQQYLRYYYRKIFPCKKICQWLDTHDHLFPYREFSFTLIKGAYLRYLQFMCHADLQIRIHKLCPQKIDIGAIYNATPGPNTIGLKPLLKEFVIDIDISDYNDVRTCCTESNICKRCWQYMVIAVKILHHSLKNEFSFKHILWVFSGRRGIHCWISDKSALSLNEKSRYDISEHLIVVKDNFNLKRKVRLPEGDLLDNVKCALHIIKPIFIKFCVEDQNMLGTLERIDAFLKLLPNKDEIQEEIKTILLQHETSLDRWNKSDDWKYYSHFLDEVMLQYCYPRIDMEVSRSKNHLLKCPFTVHPETGKIALPFKAKRIENFDPTNVPTLKSLLKIINDVPSKKFKSFKVDKDVFEQLSKAIIVFEKFIDKLEAKEKKLINCSGNTS